MNLFKVLQEVFRKRSSFQQTARATMQKRFPRFFVILIALSWLIVPIAIALIVLIRSKRRVAKLAAPSKSKKHNPQD